MKLSKMISGHGKWIAVFLSLVLVMIIVPISVMASDSTNTNTFTFTDSSVTASDTDGSGYSISGTTLTISEAGTYTVTGSCSDGSIVVKKGTTDVVIVLNNLTLSSSSTAPVVIKKECDVTLTIKGTNTLTDLEDPDDEDSTDTTVADAFEGAAIKVKSGSSLLIKGTGTLTCDGSACKNGIKGGSEAEITIGESSSDTFTLNIKSANNGLACDNDLTIKGGKINIDSDGDGVKAEPDDDDTVSEGYICITGGTLDITAAEDGIQNSGKLVVTGGKLTIESGEDAIHTGTLISISGGTFDIDSTYDAIQSEGDLKISGGTFDITTFKGYKYNSSLGDNSAKGLKTSSNDDSSTDTSEATNTLTVTGGTFSLNTADDAVHSDAYVEITGGSFTIYTGDDGVHADTTLALGVEGSLESEPDIDIKYCYEGLEAGTVNIYSGTYSVIGSDDGINAAGGSSDGTDGGMGGDNFNPGGGGPGGGWGGNSGTTSTGNYSLNIYGGNIYVNVEGDGLDSNGNINLYGGYTVVFGMKSGGDNEPIDCDGSVYIKGATIFAAGGVGMGQIRPASGSQYYVASTSSISSGKTVNIKNNGTTVYNIKAVKNLSYVFFSSPDVTSSGWSITSDSSSIITSCVLGHTWVKQSTTATETSDGTATYKCSVCGETATGTDLATDSSDDDDDDTGTDTGSETGFTDVSSDSWYYTAVYWAVENEITNGMTDTTFEPNTECSRAMIVTFLYRAAGSPSVDGIENPFTDVKEGSWYYDAVLWAVENGITKGMTDTTFAPNSICTRAQTVAFLMRYTGGSASGDSDNPFTDVSESAWYYEAVMWAVENGITNGMTSTTFVPDGNCTRGQIVTFLYRAVA